MGKAISIWFRFYRSTACFSHYQHCSRKA